MANNIPLSGASEGASGALLPDNLVSSVVEQIQRESGALNLVDTATTSSRKESIPVYKGRPQAQFVDEGDAKPVDGGEFSTVSLNVKKLAVIVPFTDEVLADAQEDPRALVTPDVVAAFADAADNAIVNGPSFDSNLVGDADDSVSLGADINEDGLRKSVSQAMAKLEGNGYTANGVLLGPDAGAVIRDARSAVDSTQAIYEVGNPFYGLSTALSTNLAQLSGTAGDACGVVADWNYARFRVRSDLTLAVSNQAAYTEGGNLVSAFEKNVTLLRWEMRCGFVITDPRAVVVINQNTPAE